MTRIDLAAELACSAEQAWGLLTDPEQKNTWSAAPTRVADLGGDDRFDRPGALREVQLTAPLPTRVHEVVTVADEPHRLDYMVYKGAPLLRNHHGRIDIESTPAGCAVRWTVDVSFASKLGVIATSTLRREMERSLAGLSEQSKLMPPSTASVATPLSVERPRRSPAMLLRPEVNRQLGHQRLLAEDLARAGDPKYWFARGYVLVNEEMLALIDAHVIENPDWLLHVMSILHNHYVSNLHAYRTGGPVSPRWRQAWAACDESETRRPSRRAAVGTVAGTRAYMAEDMPRALAEVYEAHYRDTRHYKEFRADYIRLASVYLTAADRILAEMPSNLAPRLLRRSMRLLPDVRDLLLRTVYYDVESDRMRAFDRGYELTQRSS